MTIRQTAVIASLFCIPLSQAFADQKEEHPGPPALTSAGRLCDELAANRNDLDLPDGVAGVPFANLVDSKKAVDACRNAVKREPDNRRFVFQLGRLQFRRGQFEKAAGNFRKASEAGSAMATHSLGYITFHGCGVPKDLVKAVAFYRDAAGHGQTMSMINLAGLLEHGWGREVTADQTQAYDLVRKAASLGNGDAMNALGDQAMFGYNGAERDTLLALQWYEMARSSGSLKPYPTLYYLYSHGDIFGLRKDAASGARILADGLRHENRHIVESLIDDIRQLPEVEVEAVQAALIEMNILRGKADGKPGARTLAALTTLKKQVEGRKHGEGECYPVD